MGASDFVHLQCQSEYSVKNSLIRVSKLIESVQEAGMTSIALTDDMSLFSAIKFYQKAFSAGNFSWHQAYYWSENNSNF